MLNRIINKKEEKYYKQIVHAANVAIVKFNNKFIISDFTGNSEKIFGFRKEEVIGKSLFGTIVPPVESTGRDLEKMIEDIVESVESYEYNVNENIKKGGEKIWMQWYNSEIRDEKNELTGILSIGINVTDRINTEIALKESQERFKTLSNLTFEGILIHDNGIILDCNLSFERQIGYQRDELIGMQIFDKLIPERYRDLMFQNITNDFSQYEAEAVHKDGTIIPISIESKRVKVGNKYVRVAAVRNISELKKTINELDNYKKLLEEKVKKRTGELKHQNEILQLERNQLRTIIDHIPDLIYIKDRESRFLNVNARLIELFKKDNLNDVIGKNDFDFFKARYAKKYYSDEQNIFKTGQPIINNEELSVDEFNHQIYISTTKVPLMDRNGNIIGLVGIGRNITDRIIAEKKLQVQAKNLEESNSLLEERNKRIENLNVELTNFNKKLETANNALQERKEELETTLDQLKQAQTHLIQSEKMASLGVLVAGIAHEINNPVNFVYAGVNSVIKDFDDVKHVVDRIINIEDSIKSLEEFLANLNELKEVNEFDVAYKSIEETLNDIKLGATRIKEIVAGLSRFSRIESENWKKADLHEEIESVLVLLKNKYKHHIKIIKNYDDKLPLVECYPGKLNQVFMNIINNAIDAINGKNGTIAITTGIKSDIVNISIHDTGKGIGEDIKTKIFDPFFTTKDVGLGLGLGLAISYTIIQEHGGEIIVNNKQIKGTEFIIKIPIHQNT